MSHDMCAGLTAGNYFPVNKVTWQDVKVCAGLTAMQVLPGEQSDVAGREGQPGNMRVLRGSRQDDGRPQLPVSSHELPQGADHGRDRRAAQALLLRPRLQLRVRKEGEFLFILNTYNLLV